MINQMQQLQIDPPGLQQIIEFTAEFQQFRQRHGGCHQAKIHIRPRALTPQSARATQDDTLHRRVGLDAAQQSVAVALG
jgi:hypothetical protein